MKNKGGNYQKAKRKWKNFLETPLSFSSTDFRFPSSFHPQDGKFRTPWILPSKERIEVFVKYGIRVPSLDFEIDFNKPTIFCFGNSFMYGSFLKYKDTFPAHLSEFFPDYQCLNLGFLTRYQEDQRFIDTFQRLIFDYFNKFNNRNNILIYQLMSKDTFQTVWNVINLSKQINLPIGFHENNYHFYSVLSQYMNSKIRKIAMDNGLFYLSFSNTEKKYKVDIWRKNKVLKEGHPNSLFNKKLAENISIFKFNRKSITSVDEREVQKEDIVEMANDLPSQIFWENESDDSNIQTIVVKNKEHLIEEYKRIFQVKEEHPTKQDSLSVLEMLMILAQNSNISFDDLRENYSSICSNFSNFQKSLISNETSCN